MSSNNAKGKFLELVVALLEKTLVNNPDTFIRQNHKIPDQHNVKREFDIYVEVKINSKTFKYAFECKHQKKGISLKDIVDFNAKIENMGIQGYFVTTSHYQKGAHEKAQALSIDLLTLKKREASPDDIKGIFIYKRQFEIAEIIFSGFAENTEQEQVKQIFSSCKNCRKYALNCVDRMVIPVIAANLDAGIKKFSPQLDDIRQFKKTFGKENAKELLFIAVMKDTSVTHAGTIKINIDKILVKIKVWNDNHRNMHLQPHHFLYSYEKGDKEEIFFSMSEFLLEEQNMIVCISKEKDNRKLLLSSKDDINSAQSFNTTLLGSVDELGLRELFGEEEDYNC